MTSMGLKKLPNMYTNCALVGSQASLNLLGRHTEIDSHHTIIRVNRIPTPEAYNDLGHISTILFQNLSNTRDVAKGNQGFRWDHVQFQQMMVASPCDTYGRDELEAAIQPFADKGIWPVGMERYVHADLICSMRGPSGAAPST